MSSHRKAVIKYVRKESRVEVGGPRDCCDFIFKVQGHQPETVSIGITGGWFDFIPSLGKVLTDEELKAISAEFLERELANGWVPSQENNRLEIPYPLMEYRVQNGSFPN
jgi:hypothetical protein